MLRRLFTLLSVASLVMCILAATLWAVSHTGVGVASHRGRLYAWHIAHPPGVDVSVHAEHRWSRPAQLHLIVDQQHGNSGRGVPMGGSWSPPRLAALGGELRYGELFRGLGSGPGWAVVGYWVVVVPHWWLVTVLAAVPGLAAARAVRRHQRAAGSRCAACGYDLRATPGRCPECGTVPEKPVDGRPEPEGT